MSNYKDSMARAWIQKLSKQLSNSSNNDTIDTSLNTYTLDMKGCSNKNFTIEISDVAQKTIVFTNVPTATNLVLSALIKLKYDNAANIIYPTGTKWYDDVTPILSTGKQYLIQLISYDSGNTWMGNIINKINTSVDPPESQNPTYSITFNVANGINNVSGATITILNQILTTNPSGIATLTNVNPNSNIPYTISKQGFITSTGTLNVSNANVTQNVILTLLPTYNVTFTVTDGTNPLEGAIITIKGQTLTTDSSGVATATNMNTGSGIIYTANKNGYNPLSNTLNIVDQNIAQNVVLSVTTSFNISAKQPKVLLSLAKINPSYTGACLNVRRSSDNATQDIAFVNNYLDLVSLTSFVGKNNGYVTKWYDSSGNGNDFIQSVTANQPRIVYNGIPDDGIWFSGSSSITLTLAPNATVNNLSQFSILSQYKPISKNAGAKFYIIDKGSYKVSFYDTINAMYVDKNYSSKNASFYRNSGGIKLSQYNDLAVTYDVSSASNYPRIYADGVSGGVIKSFGNGTSTDDSANSIIIGSGLQGNIKSLILCNFILTDTDIIDERTLINSITPPQLTGNITFNITDGTNPISGASITFNGVTKQSDVNGIVSYSNINYGLNQSYTVTKTGYYAINSTVNINEANVTKNVAMTVIPSAFSVTFTVTDGIDNVSGANIAFNNTNVSTDSSGVATFNNVPIGTGIQYTISKTNYRNTVGTLDIVDANLTPKTVLSTLSTVATNAYYVSPTGSDANNGLTPDTPFATLQRAQTEARKKTASGLTQDCYVYLRGGYFNLANTWLFASSDSGTNNYKIVYKNYNNETPIITCSQTLTGWSLYNAEKNIYVVDTNMSFNPSFIYEGNQIAKPARYPNAVYNKVSTMISSDKYRKFGFNSGDIPVIQNLSDAQIFCWAGGDLGVWNWSTNLIGISSIDYTNNIVTLSADTSYSLGAGSRYWIQNAIELLDNAGEFYLDKTAHKLYYIPRGTFDPNNITVPTFNAYCISLYSPTRNAIKNIRFEGLTIERAKGTAFFILKTLNVEVVDCVVRNISSGAIYSQECVNNLYSGNHIYNVGGDGIVVNGLALSSIPTSTGNLVINNKIHDIGRSAGSGVCIALDSADNATVSYNQLYNSPRWAISFGGKKKNELISKTIDGIVVTESNVEQFRHGVNNTIEYNEVYNCNTDSEDTAPIYSYGAGNGNIVRYNSVHDSGVPFSGGYGIYLDDGADGTLIDSNIMYNMQTYVGGEYRGLFIKGLNNVVKNNILADSPTCLGALVPSSSTDPVGNIKFYNNIVFNSGNIMYDMYGVTDLVTESNYNTFYSLDNKYLVYRNAATSVEDLRLGTYLGTYDQNSITENPLFINAYSNDYRLKYNSPCRVMGNTDIDFGSIGLTSSYIYADSNDDISKVYVTNSKSGYEPNVDLALNEQITLSVYLRTINGYRINTTGATVTIESDNPSVASISGNQVTGNAKGIATITVTVTKNSITKSTKIYILVADVFKYAYILSPYSRLTAAWNNTGKTKLLPVYMSELGRFYNASSGTFTFSSSDTTKLVITPNGIATILGTGNIDILVDGVINGVQKSGLLTIKACANDLYDEINLVRDGDMQTDSSLWKTQYYAGTTGSISYDNSTISRSLKMIISNAPTSSSQQYAQLYQENITGILKGAKYRFMIDKKSIPNLQFWVYSDVGLSTAPTCNSNFSTFVNDFIASKDTNSMTLFLYTGMNNGTYWFDNIGLYRLNNYRSPEPPTSVQVIDNSTSLSLLWTASTTTITQGYNVYLNGIKINTSLITQTNYDAIVANDINYSIQLTSVDGEGNESHRTSAIEVKRL